MIDLASGSDFVRMFRGSVFVIKVGGACLARPSLIASLARQVAVIDACGAHPLIVHGVGPQVDDVQRHMGEEPVKHGGRRVTTEVALKALVRCGREQLGPALANELVHAGARPALLAAEDYVEAVRRKPVQTPDGEIDFGFVGDLWRADTEELAAIVQQGRVPILCPPVADRNRPGGKLNANADLLAAKLAAKLHAEKLVLVTSTGGILTDPEDARSAISTLSLEELDALERGGALQGGMAVKATAVRNALGAGVPRVHVVSGMDPEALLGELYTTHGTGTLITRRPEVAPSEKQALEKVQA